MQAPREVGMPFQSALASGARPEALVLSLPSRMMHGPWLVSIAGVGASDAVSRDAVLAGLLAVRIFLARPQGEGGEQGDPLMPALLFLTLRVAFQSVQSQFQHGEVLVAFLDDVYEVVSQGRVRPVLDLLAQELFLVAHIQFHHKGLLVHNVPIWSPLSSPLTSSPSADRARSSPEGPASTTCSVFVSSFKVLQPLANDSLPDFCHWARSSLPFLPGRPCQIAELPSPSDKLGSASSRHKTCPWRASWAKTSRAGRAFAPTR